MINNLNNLKFIIMSIRTSLITCFILSVLVLIHRQKFTHSKFIHYQANNTIILTDPQASSSLQSLSPSYYLGQYAGPGNRSIGQILTRKKINNFIFVYYNQYKIEITFVDLGYASTLLVSFFSQASGTINYEEKIGFSLEEDFNKMNMNMEFKKKFFNLTVKQHQQVDPQSRSNLIVTTFNLSLARQEHDSYSFNLTHYLRKQQCFTAVREGDISYKCYGGFGYGQVTLSKLRKEQKQFNGMYIPTLNLTRCAFDGFRASGFEWKWTWAMASGFSKPEFYENGEWIDKSRWIGLNFGTLHNFSEDFLFINGKIYPIQHCNYKITQKSNRQVNLTFTGVYPQFETNFTILTRQHKHQDLGILKNEMIKFQGHWAGWIINPEDGKNITFYQLAGLVETADSIF